MATRTVADVAKDRREIARRGFAADTIAECRRLAGEARRVVWPSNRWRDDPVGFAREVLGVEPWAKQIEILEAVRDHKRVSVRSGHKCGKSNTAAIIALWFYCAFPDARVVLSSVTSRQVDAILWREVRKILAKAKIPIDGDVHELARSGLKASDFREIVGFTAREAEAVAGVSGANLLYLLDEASGIPDLIFEAIEGNRAGGARVLLMSNPTKTEGEFYRSHTEKKDLYRCIHVSSEDTPNASGIGNPIPGLATREWVEEKKQEWGEDSALYQIRVRGNFVTTETGKIFSVHTITSAVARWQVEEFDEHRRLQDGYVPPIGRLCVGLDPAGPGLAGDETSFAIRRGLRALGIFPMRGLSEAAVVAQLLGFLKLHRVSGEPDPIVAIDREGPIGYEIYSQLLHHLRTFPKAFVLVGVRSSERAQRRPELYDRIRDELYAALAVWFNEGGAIPADSKLDQELNAPSWEQNVIGRLKATPKDELRKLLGRSPDRADSLALSVWAEGAAEQLHAATTNPEKPEDLPYTPSHIDPYASESGDGVYG